MTTDPSIAACDVQDIIIDTDVGWDDVISILLMLKNDKVRIRGITVTGCGESYLDDGVSIAMGLLALAGNPAPVCAGAERPSCYDHKFPRSFRANQSDVMGLRLQLQPPAIDPDRRSAVRLMTDVLAGATKPVTIISLGGLTNITDLLAQSSPQLLSRIGRIAIMGGAVDVPGNVSSMDLAMAQWNQGPIYSSNVTAEWNIFLDALAAQTAFRWIAPALPIALVPLDACNNVILTKEYIELIRATDPVASFLKSVIETKLGASAEPDPVPVFDPLATTYGVGLLTDCKTEQMVLDVDVVDTTTANTCGRTARSTNPMIPPKTVVTWASAEDFKAVFTKLANAPLPACR